MKKPENRRKEEEENKETYPGYPHSPKGQDIYDQHQDEYFPVEDEPLDMGLDVPGAEEDDALEEIGEEDEENNYYSLDDQDDDDDDDF